MTLTAGSRLGPYEIVVPLGAGGMGEVYRARDTRLGREVAIKVLPAELSSDKERLHRFEQEARAASALNHPNIVTVYDIGEADSAPYIAMELVEGKTVRELIVPGPLPVRKLLAVAAQVAEGLAKAHTAGIVHRDLKPENLMVSSDGFVKILDFGLAKLVANSAEGLSRVPTVAGPDTHPGTLLGTVGYMSPEQAAGQPLDFRSDQFSFGSILYEMATGKRAFGRPTTVDTLAAILHDEPEPIGRANDSIPAPLRWIVERCLEKDPRARYAATLDLARDLSSVREHISEVSGGEAALSPGTRRRQGALLSWSLAGIALLAGLVAGYFLRGRQNEASPVPALVRLNLAFPPEESLAFGGWPLLALSPDGRRLVYAGRRGGEQRVLYVRPLDGLEATPIPGTEGALNPFFSPDGEWVGFGADGKLKKVSLAGGPSLTLCEAALLRGASWGADGTILFSPSGSASLYRVSDKGGQPKAVTTLDAKKGERTHRWPDILPGGEAALFTIHGLSGNYDDARIGAVSLATGQRRVLFEGGTDARYVPSGHIVYLRGGALFAISFDAKRLEVTGSPVPVVDGIGQYGAAGVGHYAFSKTGSLVYAQRDPRAFEGELVWMDRKGGQHLLTEVRRAYAGPRFSPDGRRLAVASDSSVIWIYDIARSSWEQLTSGGINYAPVWSPDGKRLVFSSNRDGSIDLYVMPADRSTPPEQLTRTKTWPVAGSWSPDGRSVLVGEQNWATGPDLSQLALDGDLKLRPLLATPAHEAAARLSPDGRWMAYQSNESGRPEVYVAPYPGSGGRSLVSTNGGTNPVWSPDGRELFFRSGRQLMAATIERGPELRAGVPRALFDAPFEDFDVAPDGQRFVMVRPAHPDLPPRPLAVVLGWFRDLERRLKVQK